MWKYFLAEQTLHHSFLQNNFTSAIILGCSESIFWGHAEPSQGQDYMIKILQNVYFILLKLPFSCTFHRSFIFFISSIHPVAFLLNTKRAVTKMSKMLFSKKWSLDEPRLSCTLDLSGYWFSYTFINCQHVKNQVLALSVKTVTFIYTPIS